MLSHHTKCKGDLGVLKAQLDLFEQGFTICVPQTEHAPFDLVAYRHGEFRRVQVKYRALNANGALAWTPEIWLERIAEGRDAQELPGEACKLRQWLSQGSVETIRAAPEMAKR
jgi:hypothetical protein